MQKHKIYTTKYNNDAYKYKVKNTSVIINYEKIHSINTSITVGSILPVL